MIHHLAVRMRDMHALGFVHRDLKPANIMWLPRQNRWTVIDFGCVAQVGDTATLGFSYPYAAPEVIAAYRKGDTKMVVTVCALFFLWSTSPIDYLQTSFKLKDLFRFGESNTQRSAPQHHAYCMLNHLEHAFLHPLLHPVPQHTCV